MTGKQKKCTVCDGKKTITTPLNGGGSETHRCAWCDGTGIDPIPKAICSRCHGGIYMGTGANNPPFNETNWRSVVRMFCPACGEMSE